MTPWDWLAPSTASRTRVSYTGRLQRQNGAILDGHLGEPPRLVARQGRKILELYPNPPLTRDQVRLLKTDKVLSGMQPTLGDLGVQSRRLDDFLVALKDKCS
jgi:hypothetical protein